MIGYNKLSYEIHEKTSYDLVKLTKGKRGLKIKWIYRIKHKSNFKFSRYKLKLVVKDICQKNTSILMKFSHILLCCI